MEKGLANVAESENGVWVAGLDDSGDEGMADNEFDDFMDIGDDFEEDYEEEEVLNLTQNLKNLLHITTIPSPYDVSNDLNDMLDSINTSSDDKKDIAM